MVGIYWLWKRRVSAQLRDASDYEWDIFQKNEPKFVDHLDRESFYTVFHRTHFPRYPGYWIGCISAFLLSLPVIFMLLYVLLWLGVKIGIVPRSAEVADNLFISDGKVILFDTAPTETALIYAQNLSGFYYFFGVISAWLLILTLFLRHYHKTRPGYLRDEIIRAR